MVVDQQDTARAGWGFKKSGCPPVSLFVIAGGLSALVMAMVLSLTQGAVQVPFGVVWEAFFHFDPDSVQHLIIWDLRLPRILASILVGAALAVAGAVMQGITQNPMADSGLMGLNAGAGFILSLCFTFFPGIAAVFIMLSAFLGAAIGAGLVYGIAAFQRGGATPMRLVLAGAAVSALLTALGQGIAIYFGVARDIMFWLTGGVAGVTWQQLGLLLPWVVVALLAAILLSRSVSLLSLGTEVAQGLGLRTGLVNLAAAVVVLVLAGASVAVVGPVGFVGLIIPHLARYLVGVDFRVIIPVSAVLGSLLLVLADLGARTLNPDFETPIGALIALIGVPFFLYLARQQRREV
ncbi:Iron(3+)-hydroxamate import system permease protein FhuB [uncultured Sporomusa sp.]|uniref:Iron(3+)-hydroxamate import system permease protein FhuB n=1 Tax=uncultured Sporomusa sp. TaxID=307249 RepID=A0A212LYV8_9FIRM|nr:iron ABC transporter permease [uncultured Sporomusa sp.]SCM82711.1 Iron(3+)-hydroxamate import system permease protein FhuB [uncultured Sporomusa sp.]